MNSEALGTLASFRSGIAEPDDATAKRVYERAVAQRPRRILRASPPRITIAVALAALVLVPAAVAFGGRIVDFFEGTPPTPAVSAFYEGMNRMADMAVAEGFATKFPKADVSRIHGVIEIQTADGPQDLWAAPTEEGGSCWFVDFAGDPSGPHGQLGYGSCDLPTPPTPDVDFEDYWTAEHPELLTALGRVRVPAASVRLTLSDGSAVAAPVVEGFYLVSLANGDRVVSVTAFDTAGNQVAAFDTGVGSGDAGPGQHTSGSDGDSSWSTVP
jgi:hypothetical protein